MCLIKMLPMGTTGNEFMGEKGNSLWSCNVVKSFHRGIKEKIMCGASLMSFVQILSIFYQPKLMLIHL